jgi:hypothetical protein
LTHPALIGALGRLAGLVEAAALDIEQPAVIAATDPFRLDATVIK